MKNELSKAIMQRTRLRNNYLKQSTETTKVTYDQQRKECVSHLKKLKTSHFESLNVKFFEENKKNLEKKISPHFSNKIKSKKKIAIVKNDEIISSNIEVAKTLQNFCSFVAKNSKIQRDEINFSKTTQDNQFLAYIEKFSKHLSIISIKKRMETVTKTPTFKEDQFFFENQLQAIKHFTNFIKNL